MRIIIIQNQHIYMNLHLNKLGLVPHFILVCLIMSCNGIRANGINERPTIVKIKISNYTGNHRIPHEIEITDFSTIDEIESGIDNLRLLAFTPNLRANT